MEELGKLGVLSILGSTGSIGTQALDVVKRNSEFFKVHALTAHKNISLLEEQIKEFKPCIVAVSEEADAEELKSRVGNLCEVRAGSDAVVSVAKSKHVHTVVCGISGFAALEPVLAAVSSGRHLALANKECIVAAGEIIKNIQKKSGSVIVPVDSEHNSIFQCLSARTSRPRRVMLTASGGPFLNMPRDELDSVTPEQAVKHPQWNMGAKISVDSATLMNKGLEVIEAAILFDLDPEEIEVLIHPQSIIHGLIEYEEGTVLAAMYHADMRVPIAHAIMYLRAECPRAVPGNISLKNGTRALDLFNSQKLEFYPPDYAHFPALSLCYQALKQGAAARIAVNAGNEVAVSEFLNKQIRFSDIHKIVKMSLEEFSCREINSVHDIFALDSEVRLWTKKCLQREI